MHANFSLRPKGTQYLPGMWPVTVGRRTCTHDPQTSAKPAQIREERHLQLVPALKLSLTWCRQVAKHHIHILTERFCVLIRIYACLTLQFHQHTSNPHMHCAESSLWMLAFWLKWMTDAFLHAPRTCKNFKYVLALICPENNIHRAVRNAHAWPQFVKYNM